MGYKAGLGYDCLPWRIAGRWHGIIAQRGAASEAMSNRDNRYDVYFGVIAACDTI